jgi:hypothetical protein
VLPRIVAAAQDLTVRYRGLVPARWSVRGRVLLVTFCGVMIGATAAWWGFPPVAAAATCMSPGGVNTLATNSTANFNHYGTRVANPGMQVFSGGSICLRVSSIFAMSSSPTSDNAEIGWANAATGQHYCNGVAGNGHPTVFYAWVVSGSFNCHQDNTDSISAPNFYSFSARYDLSNGAGNCSSSCKWIFDFNGKILDQPSTLLFNQSNSASNSERHNTGTGEIGHAVFQGLQFRSSSSTWNDWGQSLCWSFYNSDPDYHDQLLSATSVQVTTQSAVCSY